MISYKNSYIRTCWLPNIWNTLTGGCNRAWLKHQYADIIFLFLELLSKLFHNCHNWKISIDPATNTFMYILCCSFSIDLASILPKREKQKCFNKTKVKTGCRLNYQSKRFSLSSIYRRNNNFKTLLRLSRGFIRHMTLNMKYEKHCLTLRVPPNKSSPAHTYLSKKGCTNTVLNWMLDPLKHTWR